MPGFRVALSRLAQVVERGSLLAGRRKLLAVRPQPLAEPEVGQALLEALRRRASQLLNGKAHAVCLAHLEAASCGPVWSASGSFREICFCAAIIHCSSPGWAPRNPL